jgi:hypothetical protein
MKPQLYELLWEIVTDVGTFYHCEFKVFCSDAEAKHYGKGREYELNGGLTIEKRAQDGYYYKYRGAGEVKEVHGYQISLMGEHPPTEADEGG